MNTRLFVIGCGSIGQRHIRNLITLGMNDILAFDPNTQRLKTINRDFGVVACRSVEEGYGYEPVAVFVCTPPHLHLSLAHQAVVAGCHVFIEKPIANSLNGIDGLLEEAMLRDRIIYVGYNLRFHPGLIRIKQMLDKGTIGEPLGIKAEFGQYLPDWRPNEDYRTNYTANTGMGGGIILDASHELDYVRWFGGEVESVSCMAAKVSRLEMDAEDTAEITLRMRKGIIAQVHVDCTQRAYTRTCKVVGTEGTLIWDYDLGVRHYDVNTNGWHDEAITVEPNSMYLEEIKHFLACERGEASPLVDGVAGKAVLTIALAAIRSAAERGEVIL